MIWFAFVYLGPRFVLLDVSMERRGALVVYVAAVSAEPELRCEDTRPDRALGRLVGHLRGAASPERTALHVRCPAVS